jgi:hypothetical protein
MDWSLPARLLLAHIVGDFLLQPDSWVADRNAHAFRSPKLYLHALIHFALAATLSFRADGWLIGLIIAAGHLLFDGLKALLRRHDIAAFITDQLLHIFVIGLCCALLTTQDERSFSLQAIIENETFWWLSAGYAFNIFLCPKLIALATANWRQHMPGERELLYKAGRWIGIIERMMAFTFVLVGQWSAIGFLIAAKSIFRFGDLREGRDKGQTEYMLIGTLLSFGLAIASGLAVQALLKHLAA